MGKNDEPEEGSKAVTLSSAKVKRAFPKAVGAIRNKIKRTEVYMKQKKDMKKEKKKERLKRQREREQLGDAAPPIVIKTIENTREKDDTIVDVDDEEVKGDQEMDEYSDYFKGLVQPKLLITTSNRANNDYIDYFIKDLLAVFPNSCYYRRGKYHLKEIIEYAKNRGFTDLMVIVEHRKMPSGIILSHLPNGPTATFRVSGVKLSKEIEGHGEPTGHYPELMMNKFVTRLGQRVGRMMSALFPIQTELHGRQVCTFHNQRDFIFFRHNRYIFEDREKVRLQELGPRFTLRLETLQNGTFDTRFGEYEWFHRNNMETTKRKFFL